MTTPATTPATPVIRIVTLGADTWLVAGCSLWRLSDVVGVAWNGRGVEVQIRGGTVSFLSIEAARADVDALIALVKDKA